MAPFGKYLNRHRKNALVANIARSSAASQPRPTDYFSFFDGPGIQLGDAVAGTLIMTGGLVCIAEAKVDSASFLVEEKLSKLPPTVRKIPQSTASAVSALFQIST